MKGENSRACVSCSASTHCSMRVSALETSSSLSPVAAIAKGRTCRTFLPKPTLSVAQAEGLHRPHSGSAWVHSCHARCSLRLLCCGSWAGVLHSGPVPGIA